MKKSIFVGSIVALAIGLLALVAAPNAIANTHDRDRLDALRRKAVGRTVETVKLYSMSFSETRPRHSEAEMYDGHEIYHNREIGVELTRISQRIGRMKDPTKENSLVPGAKMGGQFGGNHRFARTDFVLGVEAFKVVANDGSRKYFATAPSTPVQELSIRDVPSDTTLIRSKNKLKRSDFINPEDIDWFFGVKDFTQGK